MSGRQFQARFSIPQILEFYAATEGNFSLYNVEGKPGAIGRIPPLLAHRFPASIVRIDPESSTPLRNADGLCAACAIGEAGEAIGRIGTADEAGGRFEGYTNTAETEKKILRDVFAKGDAWFRTGDLMKIDDGGFFHFVDRLGDTFRWKGENVATSEVNEAILECPGVIDATTYGVAVRWCRRPRRHGCDRRRCELRFHGVSRSPFAKVAGLCMAGLHSLCARRWRPPKLSSRRSRT